MKLQVVAISGIAALCIFLGSFIDLDNLDNYAGQNVPVYITKDNTPGFNPLTNPGATLGRVLFYDKNLSLNHTISCSSCHQQALAFSDDALVSTGQTGGSTGRHSMRLAYSRFSDEDRFFWDERALSLEDQTSQPIQDFTEMGFSGENGQPGLDSLANRLEAIDYYQTLFTFVYGDPQVTEERIQMALSQFVRSIYSFDSRFDDGLAATGNLNAPFPNYTQEENQGKQLFLAPPPAGGAGCQGCHRAPEFDIDPASLNNGIIGVAGNPGGLDLTNTRAPSLRDLFNPNGEPNGPFMHTGNLTITQVLNHYNLVPQNPANTNLDQRVSGPGGNLQLTNQEQDAIIAFLHTLTSSEIYTNARWSDPFDAQGNLDVVSGVLELAKAPEFTFDIYPNPAVAEVRIRTSHKQCTAYVFDSSGKIALTGMASSPLNVSALPAGIYLVLLKDQDGFQSAAQRLVVR